MTTDSRRVTAGCVLFTFPVGTAGCLYGLYRPPARSLAGKPEARLVHGHAAASQLAAAAGSSRQPVMLPAAAR